MLLPTARQYVRSRLALPSDLRAELETEWLLVPLRWVGIVLMLPALQLIPLQNERRPWAYGLLLIAALFNLTIQTTLRRWPGLFASGYFTTTGDALLNVGMIGLAGGFESPFYFVLYTVTIATAMRYGHRPTAVVMACFVGCDLLSIGMTHQDLGGPFLVRSGFLILTGILAGHLRAQTSRAQAALQEQLRSAEYDANHDRLTGLPNRTFLMREVTSALAAATHTADTLALLLLDLDGFKEVNDTLGHHHGDILLSEVSGRFTQALSGRGTVARLGGDEFGILLPGVAEPTAIAVAQELQSALQSRFVLEDVELEIRASLGIAVYPAHGTDVTTLLQHADVAMYVAKRSGGGHALYAPALDQHSAQRLARVAELREALDTGSLIIALQPKVALRTGQVVGAEALVRWRRADGSLVPPDQFIPLAEQSGLIGLLTRRVLDAALQQAHYLDLPGRNLSLAVNISMRDLQDPELPTVVERMLARWCIPPTSLVLEITESGLMAEPARVLESVVQLSRRGVRLAVDDFGTGYSSLSYLKRLPISELKIDRSFVQDMAVDDGDRTIVKSTIGLAHDLGLTVVAEGVEDATTWDVLRGLNCDVAQGYFISPPLAPADFDAWLRSRMPAPPLKLAA